MKPTHIALLNIVVALIYAGAIVLIDPTDTGRNWIILAWFVTTASINTLSIKQK